MEKKRNAVRAGIFMLVSVVMVIFVIIAISGAAKFTQRFSTYGVLFSLQDDIGGLRPGDDVRIGGLKVGDVQDIVIHTENTPDNQPQLIVYIQVPSRYPLTTNAIVSVQKSITGSAAMNIDDLGTGTLLAGGGLVHGHPDSLSALFRKLGAMGPDIQEIVTNVKSASAKLNTDMDKLGQTADAFTETSYTATATVRELHVRLPEIIGRYDQTTASAIRMLDTIHDLLGPSAGDIHTTIRNVRAITSNLHDRMPELLDDFRSILEKTDVAVTRAATAMQDIQNTTGSLRSIVVDNRSKFDGIISSLKATSDNLKFASVEIRHSPWRLLYQPKPDEVANLNIYDSVRQFAEGADQMDDAAEALRDAAKDPNADPAQVKKLMADLDESFARFQAVEDKLWSDIKQ
jgi:phospholipid/cholesterol/gamma-HCH transport system substrate-binding protein